MLSNIKYLFSFVLFRLCLSNTYAQQELDEYGGSLVSKFVISNNNNLIDSHNEIEEDKLLLTDLLRKGKCKGLWRPDTLPGRCFGLKVHSKYAELDSIKVVESWQDCKAICCNMEEKCVSWQYQAPVKECLLGPPVRLGFEHAPTGDWCEPFAPAKWNGKRLESRDPLSGVCTWGESIQTQCFGMGDERKNSSGGSYTTSECEAACCSDSNCGMWQELPGRGCFYAQTNGGRCDKIVREKYFGGRKCVPRFCGGLEDQILPYYNGTTFEIPIKKKKNKRQNKKRRPSTRSSKMT
eukprot:gene6269-8633_t